MAGDFRNYRAKDTGVRAVKILVRATNWIGDAILSIPAFCTIRQRWPEAEVTILARQSVAQLYAEQTFADRVMPLDGSPDDPLASERIAKKLRDEKYDCAVLFQNAFSAAWLVWRARIPERIGYARDGRKLLLTKAVRVPGNGEIPAHETYYYLELLRRAGWLDTLPNVTQISLRVRPESAERAESQLREAGVRAGSVRIAVAPGAAYGSAKCWLRERFAAVADGLIDEFGGNVILFGTSSEAKICDQIAAGMRHRPLMLAGRTTMGELPGLFSRCALFVGNDSGAMHVAGAVGVPIIAVFGSSDPQGTAPMASRKTLVRHAVACSPCFLRECPIDHRCMTRVPADEVRSAAATLLRENLRA